MKLFSHAFTLYRRTVGWLLVGALAAAAIDAVARYATAAIGLSGGVGLWQAGTARSATVATGLVALAAGLLLAQVITLILHGGMMKLAIDSERGGGGGPGALFAGFARVGSYAGLGAIAYLGLPLALAAVNAVVVRVLALIVPPILVLLVVLLLVPLTLGIALWITVKWVFALPLIADEGVGALAAVSKSAGMVHRDGWWSTLARLVVLGLGSVILGAVVVVAASRGAASGSTLATIDVVFLELFVMPFVTCYVAAMYLQSGGTHAAAARVAPRAWPAASIAPAAPRSTPPGSPADVDRAWAAAADPLAGPPAE